MKGRPVPNPLLDRKLNMTNKLRPKFTVAQIQATAEIRRIRVAPKETILHPRMQNLMFDFRVHRGSPHPKRWMEPKEEPPKLKPPKVMISHAPTPEPPIQVIYECLSLHAATLGTTLFCFTRFFCMSHLLSAFDLLCISIYLLIYLSIYIYMYIYNPWV